MSLYDKDLILYSQSRGENPRDIYLARIIGPGRNEDTLHIKYFTYEGNMRFVNDAEKDDCFFSPNNDKSDLLRVQMAASFYNNCVAAHMNRQIQREAHNTLCNNLDRSRETVKQQSHDKADMLLYFPLGKNEFTDLFLVKVIQSYPDKNTVDIKIFEHCGTSRYALQVDLKRCFRSSDTDKMICAQMAASKYFYSTSFTPDETTRSQLYEVVKARLLDLGFSQE